MNIVPLTEEHLHRPYSFSFCCLASCCTRVACNVPHVLHHTPLTPALFSSKCVATFLTLTLTFILTLTLLHPHSLLTPHSSSSLLTVLQLCDI